MIAGALVAVPLLFGAPVGGAGPLDADVFDVSAYPQVLVDVVPPERYAAVDLTTDMVAIDGATVAAVAPVDPATVAVSLVIDDGPTVAADVVNAAQGASVELVRNVGEGTQIALSTPSGLMSAPTSDRSANIARIAGIVAGAPDVVPLPQLVLDAATKLAAGPRSDRQLVVALGTPIAEGPALDQLRSVVDAAGITVHLVAAPGLDGGPIADLAASSGGLTPTAPEMVGEMDQVTAAITDRSRVAATVVEPGPSAITLTVGGEQFTADLDLSAPVAPTTTAGPTTVPAAAAPPVAVPATDPTSTVAAAPAAAPSVTPTTDAPAEGYARATRVLIAAVLALLVIGALAIVVSLRRRVSPSSSKPALPIAPGSTGDAAVVVAPAPDEAIAPIHGTASAPVVADALTEPDSVPSDADVVEPAAPVAAAEKVVSPVDQGEPEPAAPVEVEPEVAAASLDDVTEPVAPAAVAVAVEEVASPVVAEEPESAAASEPDPATSDADVVEPAAPVAAAEEVVSPVDQGEPEPAAPVEVVPEAASMEDEVEEPVAPPEVEPAVVAVEEDVSPVEAEPASLDENGPEPAAAVGPVAATGPAAPATRRSRMPSGRRGDDNGGPTSPARPSRRRSLGSRAVPAEPPPAPSPDPAPAVAPPARRSRMPARRRDDREQVRSGGAPRRGVGRPSPETVVPPPAVEAADPGPGWLVVGDLRLHRDSGAVWAGPNEVHLTATELAVLELLMVDGAQGVTTEAIVAAAPPEERQEIDADAIVAQVRRKTKVRGGAKPVHKERVLLYFFGDEDDESDAE